MGVVVHDQQVLRASLWARSLVGRHEPCDVIVLQQRQAVDGALVEEVLPVGRGEHLYSDRPLIQRAAVNGSVSATPDQLKEVVTAGNVEAINRLLWHLFV